jgi:phospholipid transport system transporter-binding protein
MAGAPQAAVAFEIAGGAGQYRLGGTAGYANARRMLEDGRRRFGKDAHVQVDLGGLTALDSAGLAVLITWLGEARAEGRSLTYRDLPSALVATARVAGVESLVGVSG